MSFQGIEFTPEMRKMIVNVKQFLDRCKTDPDLLQDRTSRVTASALGISESTVKVVMSAYNKGDKNLDWKSEQRGKPKYCVESGIEPVVRKFIRNANKKGEHINFSS